MHCSAQNKSQVPSPKMKTSSPFTDAVSRICKTSRKSPHATPTFDISAMDVTVNSELIRHASPSNPIILCPYGTIAGGDGPLAAPSERKYDMVPYVEIMTGTPFRESTTGLPFDTSKRVEDTAIVSVKGMVTPIRKIIKPMMPFQNRRFARTDFRENDVVVEKGTSVTAQDVMALASLGISTISVCRRLRIAILSTGSEPLSYRTTNDESHRIRDSNGPYLQAALRQLGVDATYLGIVEDDHREFEENSRGSCCRSTRCVHHSRSPVCWEV